jgi:hypothetical protein
VPTHPTSPSRSASACSRRSTWSSGIKLASSLQRERLTELQVRGEGAQRRRVGGAQAAARVRPAQAARVDPQGAGRGRGLGRRRVPPEDRGGRDARGGSGAGRPRAGAVREDRRVLPGVAGHPQLPRLAARVPWAERSEDRLDPGHAREVLDADHAGSRTRRTASWSTWPSASCGRTAAWPTTSGPARS